MVRAHQHGAGEGAEVSTGKRAGEFLSFSLLFQSNGEIGLTQFLEENQERAYAGQEVRFCELPADAGAGFGCWDVLHGLCVHRDELWQAYLQKLEEQGASRYPSETPLPPKKTSSSCGIKR